MICIREGSIVPADKVEHIEPRDFEVENCDQHGSGLAPFAYCRADKLHLESCVRLDETHCDEVVLVFCIKNVF